MIFAGIDAGSRAIKVVLLDGGTLEVLGSGAADQGVKQDLLASRLFKKVLGDAGLRRKDVRKIVATGYGRNSVSLADAAVTEISCHARGVRHVLPGARTVIDIGGQDSKVIRLSDEGRVLDFAMNDRCAAGTGRFLELVAARLEIGVGDLGRLARKSGKPAAISSMCAVFAETEIIGLLASGIRRADIVAGVQNSIAARIASMAGRGIVEPVALTGGVALISGMDKALRSTLGCRIRIAPDPQMTGAVGAALLARERS